MALARLLERDALEGRIATVLGRYERAVATYVERFGDVARGMHGAHVMNDLAWSLTLHTELTRNGRKGGEAAISAFYLGRYLDLLERYPAFCEGEMTRFEGAFGIGPSRGPPGEYVQEAARRLKRHPAPAASEGPRARSL